ncbi:MAG: diguanylate cyclase [Acidobacteria bacterium]|nr:diguanylate cyclase [Acidobacteriota bacterium]
MERNGRYDTSKIRVAVVLLVAAFALLILVSQWWWHQKNVSHVVGMIISLDDLKVEALAPDLPAAEGGIRVGDVILALNGQAVHNGKEYDAIAVGFEPGEPATFLVRRGEGTRELVIRPGAPFPWVRFGGNIFIVLAYMGIGIIALLQPLPDIRKWLLFIFTAAIALEFALPPVDIIGRPLVSDVAFMIYLLLSGIQFGVEVHLASSIPERHPVVKRHPWLVRTFYMVGLAVAGYFGLAYLNVNLQWSLPYCELIYGRFLFDFVFFPLWAMLLLYFLGSQALWFPDPLGRHQSGLVLLGIFPWLIYAFGITILNLRGLDEPFWLNDIFALILFPFPVAVFVAMYRYQLFDIQLVVRRGLVYSALTGAMVLIFYASIGAGSFLLSQLFGGGQASSIWLFAGTALLLGLLFQPLRSSFQNFIDVRFFPEQHAFRKRMMDLASRLPAHGKVPRMGRHLVAQLQKIFDLETAALYLREPVTNLLSPLAAVGPSESAAPETELWLLPAGDPEDNYLTRIQKPLKAERLRVRIPELAELLERHRAQYVVSLVGSSALIGLLFIGPKTTGERFRADEVEMLDYLARHISFVFENARLYESATYDSLTGILRREAAFERLEAELRRSVRYDRPLTVGMADLDNFKQVNDRYGHPVGDITLRRVATAIAADLRSSDIMGRYGGEEFLLIFPETNLQDAVDVSDRFRSRIEEIEFRGSDENPYHITISVGLASLAVDEKLDSAAVEILVRRADEALLKAKADGRNCIRTYPLV